MPPSYDVTPIDTARLEALNRSRDEDAAAEQSNEEQENDENEEEEQEFEDNLDEEDEEERLARQRKEIQKRINALAVRTVKLSRKFGLIFTLESICVASNVVPVIGTLLGLLPGAIGWILMYLAISEMNKVIAESKQVAKDAADVGIDVNSRKVRVIAWWHIALATVASIITATAVFLLLFGLLIGSFAGVCQGAGVC